MTIESLGPETPEQEALRLWFEEQERKSLERIEEMARTLMQLSTGLLGALFAILPLIDTTKLKVVSLPLLANSKVNVLLQICGVASVAGLISTLFATLIIVFPSFIRLPRNNLTAMRKAYDVMLSNKAKALRWAICLFAFSMLSLTILILCILYAIAAT